VKYDLRPLDSLRTIKTKLGALVAVTVAVATVLAVLATRAGWAGWMVVPLAVAVGLAVTQVLARGMTSPLREMTVAAQRMAEGDYSQRVTATSSDEVGELARAFNRMAATLEMIDGQRRDLVANVSHELRTPISALQAVLENLVDGVSRPDPATLQVALAQTERLGRLVADLLDLSRIEEGVTPLRVKEIRLSELLTEAVSQARVDGLRYSIRVEPADLTVPGDPERLHQLLANLLDNASRHSPHGGEVRVAAALVDSDVRLQVADDGPGIAPADRQAVFERFTTSSAQHSGTGLGLAISRWVAQLHGGLIEVADTPTGRGAVLQVLLPHNGNGNGNGPSRRPEEKKMSTLTPPAPPPAAAPPAAGDTLRAYWPDAARSRPGIVGLCVAAGALAALVIPDRNVGLGTTLVFGLVAGIVLFARTRRPWTWLDRADVGLAALLLATLFVRDAAWITMLCLLAALALVAVNVANARSVLGMLATAAAVPLATLRGLPWLSRSLRPVSRVATWLPVARTVAVSAVLLLVFGALFASADALFASWVDTVTPDIEWNDIPARIVFGGFIAVGTLAAAYVALAPPALDQVRLPLKRAARPFEWLAPVVVVDVLFAAFLAAQAAALFGGHRYLQETTGLTYAEYVHEGFGQLTFATVLTLTVMAWAGRKAEPGVVRDVALGALGAMTLVVVVSALYRMHVYEEAYGFTRLRLLVTVFEGWLGIVVLLVLVSGLLGHRWLVPLAVRLGAVGLLGLAVVNPDLWIVEHNLARDTTTVPVDYRYLGELSADAWPALATLSPAQFDCATRDVHRAEDDDWLSWNISRERARDLQATRPPAGDAGRFVPCTLPTGSASR
jgi:signal transduction histidine kinase